MKTFTAIYSTEHLKGIQYSFEAEDQEAAIAFVKWKISQFPSVAIIENTIMELGANEGLLFFLNGEMIK